MCVSCSDSSEGCPPALPGGNEVLGQVDADRRSRDGDVAVARPVQLAPDLDLGSGHLPDLVDLGSLTADDRTDELREEEEEQRCGQAGE